MDDEPFIHRTPEDAATSEKSLAGRDALVAIVRLLARLAAREALARSSTDLENPDDEAED